MFRLYVLLEGLRRGDAPQMMAKVDTLFVPVGDEAVRLPQGQFLMITTVVCDRCPCVGDPENQKGMVTYMYKVFNFRIIF